MRAKLNIDRPALSANELDPKDPATRERRAILEMLRAINIGKFIAYTGSGNSAIYGYGSWTQLVDKAAEFTLNASCNHLDRGKTDDGPYFDIIDQMAAILDELLRRRKLDKSLTDDDLLALTSTVLITINNSSKKPPLRAFKRKRVTFECPGIYEVDPVASFATLKTHIEHFPHSAAATIDSRILYESLTLELKKLFERKYIPNKRLLQALSNIGIDSSVYDEDPKAYVQPELHSLIRFLGDSVALSKQRTSKDNQIAKLGSKRNAIDPIHTLVRRFRVHRFATLNYDLEIEHCLEDIEYPYSSLTSAELDRAISHTGAIGQSITLNPANAARLFSFASKPVSRSSGHQIIHIHGSIKDPESMVIFQNHYNALYTNTDRNIDSFEDALHIMLNGNAVIFTGIGLSEDDVMRPVRRSISQSSNLPLFALMPSLKSAADNISVFERIKARYGINAILYGRRTGDIPLAWGHQESKPTPIERRISNWCTSAGTIKQVPAAALHEELNWIDDIIRKLKLLKRDEISSRFIKTLNIRRTPRIVTWKHYRLIKAIFTQKRRVDRLALITFLSDGLKSIAISQALDDVLHFTADRAKEWRAKWKLKPDDRELLHTKDHGVVDAPHIQIRLRSELSKKLPNSGITILKIPAGNGKGTLFSAISPSLPEHSFAFSGSNTLFFRLFERIRIVGVGTTVYIHNAETLMDRHRRRALNHSIEQALILLGELARTRQLRVIVTCSSDPTSDYFRKIFTPKDSLRETESSELCETNSPELCETNSSEHCAAISSEIIQIIRNSLAESNPVDLVDAAAGSLNNNRSVWLTNFIAKMTDRAHKIAPGSSMSRILQDGRLSSINPSHRSAMTIANILAQDDDLVFHAGSHDQRSQNVLRNVLMKWLFAFALPTQHHVFRSIREVDDILTRFHDGSASDAARDSLLTSTLRSMEDLGLLLKLNDKNYPGRKDPDHDRYILHSEVRRYLSHQRGHSFVGLESREVSGLTLCNVLMDNQPLLTREDYATSCEVFSELIESDSRGCVRSAYGLLRGNLFLSNVMRAGLSYPDLHKEHSVLDMHLQRLLRLRACFEWNSESGQYPPLYRVDRVWVLNEIAVVLHLKGQYHDAIMLLREIDDYFTGRSLGAPLYPSGDGHEESPYALADTEVSHAQVSIKTRDSTEAIERCRIKLNLGGVLIERGHFDEAQRQFDRVEEILSELIFCGFQYEGALPKRAPQLGDRDIIMRRNDLNFRSSETHPELLLLLALNRGYVASLKYLTGKLDRARDIIAAVLNWSDSLDMAGLRGWLHAQASLIYAACNEVHKSTNEFNHAVLESRHAQRVDLMMSLEIAEANLFIVNKKMGNSTASLSMLENLDRCSQRASLLGSDKYIVGAALVRSRAMLNLSQIEGSRKALLQAICLSMRNGMRLRRIAALIQFCGLMILRGEKVDAREVLSEIRESADSIRYVNAVVDIERLEKKMDQDGGVQSWAQYDP